MRDDLEKIAEKIESLPKLEKDVDPDKKKADEDIEYLKQCLEKEKQDKLKEGDYSSGVESDNDLDLLVEQELL